MSWRIVVVSSSAKVDYKADYLVIRTLDSTKREGHAAKVYFNALFGMDFTRADDNPINAALNYGYSMILSAINREITAAGYLTQIGIFHQNTFNPFNLLEACKRESLPNESHILIDCDLCEIRVEEN